MAMTDDVIVARAPKDQRSKIFGEEADGPSSQYLREQSRHFRIATSRRSLPATSTHRHFPPYYGTTTQHASASDNHT